MIDKPEIVKQPRIGMEEFINEINFSSILDSLKSVMSKCEIDTTNVEFESKNIKIGWDIIFKLTGTTAMWHGWLGKIFLQRDDVENFKSKSIKEKDEIIKKVIHELCHALSEGYRTVHWPGLPKNVALDEAATLVMEDMIFEKVFGRKSNSVEMPFSKYDCFRRIMSNVIRDIALDTGVSEDSVGYSFILGYFKDPISHNKTLEAFMVKKYGKDFYDDYVKLNDKKSLVSFSEMYGVEMFR